MLLSIIISYGYHLNGPKKIAQTPQLSSNINFINDLIKPEKIYFKITDYVESKYNRLVILNPDESKYYKSYYPRL